MSKLLKEPDRKPPLNPLETQQEPQNAGGSAARKQDVKDDLSDIRKFTERSHSYLGEPATPSERVKFPLGETPHKKKVEE
jgi:hypothetical protein